MYAAGTAYALGHLASLYVSIRWVQFDYGIVSVSLNGMEGWPWGIGSLYNSLIELLSGPAFGPVELQWSSLEELKLQRKKICDGVVLSQYSRVECFFWV